jgi:hypothetical protein
MAATVAASKAYDLSGGALKEDLSDIIYDISPMDAWFVSHAARGTAKSTTHEWLSDSLVAASSTNASIEGDEFAAVARALPSRLKNYTQISKKSFEVTGTAQKVDNAGMRELLGYHTARAGKELKRDMEAAVLAANPASAGSSVSARVSGSVSNWIYTDNHYKMASQTTATTVAPTSGVPSGAVTAGSATAMTETDLKGMLSQAWSCGGEVDTLLCSASIYNTISGFTGLATRFRDVGSKQQAQIIGAADVYVSAFGSHSIQLSRYSPSGVLYGLDMKSWAIDYLRPFQTVEIAKIGDADRRMLLSEWTLRCNTPRSNVKITGIS